MTNQNDDDAALVDALARYHRGELPTEKADAVRAMIDAVAMIAAEQRRADDAFQRTIQRIDLRCDAQLQAIAARRLAREADALLLQAEGS